MKKQELKEVIRFNPDIDAGLNDIAVNDRIMNGLLNKTKFKSIKSYAAIFFTNIVSFYNFLWVIIFAALCAIGAYYDMLFIIIIVLNTAISIFQEIKAKHIVEKLSLVSTPKITVIRNGNELQLDSDNLVLDDIIKLVNGNEVPADSIIISGDIEVNESLLTGESNARKKMAGERILAGSFLVSGLCYARVDKVGVDNYINSIAAEAKKFKSPSSNLFKDINNLIKAIGIILVPLAPLTFIKEFARDSLAGAIQKTSAALIGMIPAGMFLLITIALAIGVVKLGAKRTLVRNPFSIEMLARANILCLDKTGTITDGSMEVIEFISFKNKKKVIEIVQEILGAQKASNSTSNALLAKFGSKNEFKLKSKLEFSSSRKCSVTTFMGKSSYILGAVSHVNPKLTKEQKAEVLKYAKQGHRVMLLVQAKCEVTEKISQANTPLAMFVIEEHIRKDAIETIAWFKNNGVEIKIISGDDPIAVSSIAKRVGVAGAEMCVSLENLGMNEIEPLAEKFTVFGRVSPEQKQMLIKALRNGGNIVAMTGDGVNDTLAIKEADCSIAMAEGSSAARNLAHMVLLDSKFSSLPSVVNEGRQVVNNVKQSSTLFLMKTIFTIMLVLMSLMTFTPYPLLPRQPFLLEGLVIGIPSVILTFQTNTKPIKGEFITTVLRQSFPFALLLLINMLIVVLLGQVGILSQIESTSAATLTITLIGFMNLVRLLIPFTFIKGICVAISGALIVTIISIMGSFFAIEAFTLTIASALSIQLALSVILIIVVPRTLGAVRRIQAREYRH